jgi:RNA polymerase sigma-70 factor (ECF subfamily)
VGEGINENVIILGLQRGDQDAWTTLCEMYSRRVWRYVSRLVGRDNEEVADVFQETMLAVAKAGRNLRADDTKLWAWLAKIAHNQAALHWRKIYRERAREGHPPLHSASPGNAALENASVEKNSDPAQLADRAESIRVVRYVLAQMPSDYVVVLVGKYMDGLSVSEIVATVGGSSESVRSRLARARRDFRERFDDIAAGTCRLDGAVWNDLSSDVSTQL